MIDAVDLAQAAEQEDRELALQAVNRRIAASFEPRRDGLDGLCIDCEKAIEPARLAALDHKTSRCARCAHSHEHRMRGYR